MAISTLATVFGVVFLLVGVLGFVAAPPPPDALPLAMNHGHGMLLDLFPVNTLHNIVHLLFGALGLLAARAAVMSARGYFQFLAVAYAVLAVLGILPATQTTFGLIPIYGNDVWLHASIAIVAGVVGFTNILTPAPAVRA